MKRTRFASYAIGGLALGLSLFGIVGCQDTPTDVDSATAVTAAEDPLYSIYKVDPAALGVEEMLPSFDDAMSGGILAQDGALLLPPPPPRGNGRGGNNGGHSSSDSSHHSSGDSTRHSSSDSSRHNSSDSSRHSSGDSSRNSSGGRDTVRRDPPRRDDAILNVLSVARLVYSLPGMNDSLLRAIMPCFRDYAVTVNDLKRGYNNSLREMRAEFNRNLWTLLNDTTLTPEQKRARYNDLKQRFQNEALTLKRGLDASMKEALVELTRCVGQHLNDEQREAFRAGLERLG